MHHVICCIREILPAELPKARDLDGTERVPTDAELLNLGLQRIGPDLYSCVEQYRSDDVLLEADGRTSRVWWPERDDGPWASEAEKRSYPRSPEECARNMGLGTLLTHGQLRVRYAKLALTRPGAHKQVMRARVIRSETVNVQETVDSSLAEQQAAFMEHVGEVRADLASDRAKLAEARRLAALPGNDIQAAVVPEAEVLAGDDVVEESGIIPHAWAGENPVAG
jgi:hypothetical protein